MDMKKNNNFFEKNKIYLIIGSLLVAWICFIFFVISPSIKMLKNNFDSVQMKIITAQNDNNKLGKLNILRYNFEKVNAERNSLDVIFHKDSIVSLVKDLESIAQKTGNEILISVDEGNNKILEASKKKSNGKENELIKILPAENYFTIKISLVGNYNSLLKFVNKLNNMKYHNTIISFNIYSEEIILENVNVSNNAVNGGINVLNNASNSADNLTEQEKKKLVLNSELDVIFYSLEKSDEKK